MKSFKTIPIIDVSPLVTNNSPKKSIIKETAKQLDEACRNVGFFYVKNHGIPKAAYKDIFKTARDFFQLPDDVKKEVLLSPDTHYRGYQPIGLNITKKKNGYNKDVHEAIDLYKEIDREKMKLCGYPESPIHGVNPWPKQVPQFSNDIKLYSEYMKKLGLQILKGIAIGLGIDENFFESYANDPYWYVRVIYYPPLLEAATTAIDDDDRDIVNDNSKDDFIEKINISCGEHTDYGLLTFVNQEEHVSALQIKNAFGEWIDAKPIPDAFVCNIGDMFKILTNGIYEPTLHRVINIDKKASRVSIPFFFEPNFSSVVKPIEKFCTIDNPCQFQSKKYGTHLESKVLSNFSFEDL